MKYTVYYCENCIALASKLQELHFELTKNFSEKIKTWNCETGTETRVLPSQIPYRNVGGVRICMTLSTYK